VHEMMTLNNLERC